VTARFVIHSRLGELDVAVEGGIGGRLQIRGVRGNGNQQAADGESEGLERFS
jgi:hypothetical protein